MSYQLAQALDLLGSALLAFGLLALWAVLVAALVFLVDFGLYAWRGESPLIGRRESR